MVVIVVVEVRPTTGVGEQQPVAAAPAYGMSKLWSRLTSLSGDRAELMANDDNYVKFYKLQSFFPGLKA